MATLSPSKSRRLYSWWWDSHISPKNSKWLQENLTDMDAKVKAMIKLIEEDADSFAIRAEMYYKKRPELMKLVEEFYRAYRALAERYNYATGELRQAHRTMAEAFPNQVPFVQAEDSSSGSYSGESDAGITEKGLTQLHEIFGTELVPLNSEGMNREMQEREGNLHDEFSQLSNENRNLKAESEFPNLKKALDDVQTEKESVLLRYQQSMEKLFSLEGELNHAKEDFSRLNEQANKAETEVHTLKEALVKLEAEREAGFIKNKECLERISNLENKISVAYEDARLLNERANTDETEITKLKNALAELMREKEAAAFQYEHCLEKISKLENEIFCAQEDVKRLNSEILMGATKLKSAEEKCVVLEMSNQSLQLEADNLVKKIALKDDELSKKHEELEKLQTCIQDEHLRYVQIEATLQTLQNLHSQSKEEQRALALELKNGLQMLKDMEIRKHGLEEELWRVKNENWSLNELNSSSTISIRNLQHEILGLRKMKERLEEQVALQLAQSNTIQQEISHLKEEIKGLNRSYQALIDQVQFVGLNPECFGSSVKELQDENSKLRQICKNERDEKEATFKKLETVEELLEKNGSLQSSLLDVNGELEGSREEVKTLQESVQFLHGEKSTLVAEKSTLLSQLQIITEIMQQLMEKNTVLEESLSGANAELAGLREKSNSLEELNLLLDNEKSNLLTENSTLVLQLENVEQRLGNLEKRFTAFEGKYAGLEKEKESTHSQVEDLRVSLGVEKQERASLMLWSETRLASLENHINFLQEESRWRKREFQEELDKAVIAQFEIFILQKCIQEMEEKNYSLLIEFQKHIEASKLSENLISELESENLEQQVEAELLLVEIEKLRLGIYKVFKALEIDTECGPEDAIENEQIFVHHILGDIENMKCSLSKYKDDKEQLLVENSVLLTLLEQMRLEGLEIKSENKNLDQAFKTIQEEYGHALEENRYLLSKFSDLKEEKCRVEEENDAVVLETLTLGNLTTIFKSFGTENAVELKLLSEDLHNLHEVNNDLEKEVIILQGKLEMTATENLLLKDSVNRLEMELSGVEDFNDQLKQEISSGKDFLRQREKDLAGAEKRLKETENLNSELWKTVEGLKWECEESKLIREISEMHILNLSEDNMNQNKEIQGLHEENGNLEFELGILREEIVDRRIREENLSSELQERSNEFELWEVEAATFYFDFQISAIREVLFEDKVHELIGACESIEDQSASNTREIEQMKETLSLKESEIGGLKAQLSAYSPVIVSLRENIASLELNTLSLMKHIVADYQKPKDTEVAIHLHEKSCQELVKDQNSPLPSGISDLQKLQTKIIEVENVVLEEINRLVRPESLSTNVKPESAKREIEELKSNCRSGQEKGKQKEERGHWDDLGDNLKLRKTRPELSEAKNGVLMKDIPLDHVIISRRGNVDIVYHQFENEKKIEDSSSELQIEKDVGVDKLQVSIATTAPNQGMDKGKILQRLTSDAKKLASLQTTVQDLRTKLETNKNKKGKEVDFDTVKDQLHEVEETVAQLVDLNSLLKKNIEEGPSDGKASAELEEAANVQRNRVSERARKWSEKIGRLQLEVQKIQYVLLKLEDEKKSKGKSRFSRTSSRTSIILRDFIYSDRKSSGRRKKAHICGCFRPSTNGDGNYV